MIKKTTGIVYSGFVFLLLNTGLYAQSNTYFQNGENWSVMNYCTGPYQYEYYFAVSGDTSINGDTLVQIISTGELGACDGVFPQEIFGSATIPSYLAKDSAGTLTLYKYDSTYTAISDTIIVDYSRMDSVSYRTKSAVTETYEAAAIDSIDTVYYNGIMKKKFYLNIDAFPYVYVYEGLFIMNGTPFLGEGFSGQAITCFGAFDSTYCVYDYWFAPGSAGNCIIPNLSIPEQDMDPVCAFPNPAQTLLHVQVDDQAMGGKFIIANIGGRVMQQGIINSPVTMFDVENYPAGIYIISVGDGSSITHLKFIKR